jgi:hypothetical protein
MTLPVLNDHRTATKPLDLRRPRISRYKNDTATREKVAKVFENRKVSLEYVGFVKLQLLLLVRFCRKLSGRSVSRTRQHLEIAAKA